eukprot:5351931-Karenia_brevis.AAC.1
MLAAITNSLGGGQHDGPQQSLAASSSDGGPQVTPDLPPLPPPDQLPADFFRAVGLERYLQML